MLYKNNKISNSKLPNDLFVDFQVEIDGSEILRLSK